MIRAVPCLPPRESRQLREQGEEDGRGWEGRAAGLRPGRMGRGAWVSRYERRGGGRRSQAECGTTSWKRGAVRESAERKQGARVGGSCDGWRRTGGPARDVSGQPRRTANGVSPVGVAPRGRHRGSRERPEPVPGVGLEHPRGDGGLPVEQRFWGVRRASSGVYSRQL